jgi:ribosomal protein S18 acetylase RimI-like enzyme
MIRKAIYSDFPKLSEYYKEFDDSGVDLFNRGPFSHIMVYEDKNEIVGFISYSIIYNRAEIDYIYVEASHRRKNVAYELMEYCIEDVETSGCENITLEVNVNNNVGIHLYEKFGFQVAATRSKYYKGEDGLLMIRELKKSE